MGWSADVLVAVRGPVREVGLFRHRFRRFWHAWDECVSCKRAWMRVRPAKRRRRGHQPAHEWWWLEPPPPTTGTTPLCPSLLFFMYF
jgi:hypothetical protein